MTYEKCEHCGKSITKIDTTNVYKHLFSTDDADCNYPEIKIPEHFKEYVRTQIEGELDRLGLLI